MAIGIVYGSVVSLYYCLASHCTVLYLWFIDWRSRVAGSFKPHHVSQMLPLREGTLSKAVVSLCRCLLKSINQYRSLTICLDKSGNDPVSDGE